MVIVKVKNDNLVVSVIGDFDLVAAKEFRDHVDRLLMDRPVSNLILDATKINFIDSSGLGALLGRYKIIQQRGGRMSIFGATPPVYRVLELSGIMKIIPILKTETLALERKEA